MQKGQPITASSEQPKDDKSVADKADNKGDSKDDSKGDRKDAPKALNGSPASSGKVCLPRNEVQQLSARLGRLRSRKARQCA